MGVKKSGHKRKEKKNTRVERTIQGKRRMDMREKGSKERRKN